MGKVVVVDFGSQYNMLLVRRVRELNASCELISVKDINEEINNGEVNKYQAIIFSGGPNVITDEGALKVDQKIFDLNIPILGVCYGMQLIGDYYGCDVVESEIKEYGAQQIITGTSELFKELDETQDVWMSHGYEVCNPSDKIEVIAKSKDDILAAIKVIDKPFYGLQFHLEVKDSINGLHMLENFLTSAGVERDYKMANFLVEQVKEIKELVGDDVVICGLSGGVDSTVVATLLNKAIGKQLKCILVDHGLLRKNEVELVVESLKDQGLDITVIDAKELFLSNLAGVSDPEQKRKIIGKLFVDVFKAEAKKYTNAKYLAQGTLYTDVVESGTNTAETIKSHHNVGGLPAELGFDLIEPLNKLFKDEVRELGLELGLPGKLVHRQPFPGPGLAIRIMGEITQDKIEVVKESDYIFRTLLEEKGLYDGIWQCFTVLTNTMTVGVKGDERSYEYVLALRAINSVDGMTAKASSIDINTLLEISTEITNRVRKINRIVYDITNKPPSTIEWE